MAAMNMVSAGGFSGVSFHSRRCPHRSTHALIYRRILGYFVLSHAGSHVSPHHLFLFKRERAAHSLSHSHSLFFFKSIYMLLSFLSCLRSILLFLAFLFRTRMKYVTQKKKKNSKRNSRLLRGLNPGCSCDW
jgi:hypothetical protein